MSRLNRCSCFMRWWSAYFFYFFAIGAAGVACAHVSGTLTRKFASSIVKASEDGPRALSRVELRAIAQAESLSKIAVPKISVAEPASPRLRAVVHPARLAAALDRAESAPARVAVVIPTPPPAVTSCDNAKCTEIELSRSNEAHKKLRVAAEKFRRKAAHMAIAAAPSKVRANRTKAIVMANPFDFEAAANSNRVRLAETPGEMILRSLSGTS